MGKLDKPGYPLPAGELGEDEIVCQLVYLPNRPEYWQAFLGAYHYLSTWRAWERDDDKRGKDAASNWREAFELTMECWRMACLEQLQQDVSDILLELQNTVNCCENSDPTDGDQYTDPVTDGEGDVPQPIIDSGYAEDSSDWEGFADYKCMIAHLVVDSMEAKLRKMAPYVDDAAKVVGGFATVAIIVSAIWSGGLSLLVGGLIAATGGVSLLYAALVSGTALITLADKIQTNHDELVCAFNGGDGSQDSIDQLKLKIDELFTVSEELILKNTGIEIDSKALYAGRFNEIDTAAALEALGYDVDDFSCAICEQIGQFRIFDDWNDGSYPPTLVQGGPAFGIYYDGEYQFRYRYDHGSGENIYMSVLWLRIFAGLDYGAGDTITINQFEFNYIMDSPNAGNFRLEMRYDGGSDWWQADNALVWTKKTITPVTPMVATYNMNMVWFIYINGGIGGYGYIKDILIDFDASPD